MMMVPPIADAFGPDAKDFRERSMIIRPTGTIIAERYRIQGVLGSGGFGTVYRAQHIHMSRAVALKVLDVSEEKPDHQEICRRFMQEAEAASRIEHPNVVAIHDVGFAGQERQPFIAMQLLDGHDLEHELETNGGMEPERALRLLCGCLDGLAAAHQLGVVHRDLKPGNLFLSQPGTAQESLHLVDFGMACILEADASRITATGQFLGTPRYVAPEYVRSQTATPAVDVYQMGLILAEMITGMPVVEAEHVYACIMMHCTGDLKLPVALLESPLGPALRCALSFDHTRRYQDASAFKAALVAVDTGLIPAVEHETALYRSLTAMPPLEGAAVPPTMSQLVPQMAEPSDPAFDQALASTDRLSAFTAGGDKADLAISNTSPQSFVDAGPEPLTDGADETHKRLPGWVWVAAAALLVGVVGWVVVGAGLFDGPDKEPEAPEAPVVAESPANGDPKPAAEPSPGVEDKPADEVVVEKTGPPAVEAQPVAEDEGAAPPVEAKPPAEQTPTRSAKTPRRVKPGQGGRQKTPAARKPQKTPVEVKVAAPVKEKPVDPVVPKETKPVIKEQPEKPNPMSIAD